MQHHHHNASQISTALDPIVDVKAQNRKLISESELSQAQVSQYRPKYIYTDAVHWAV